MANEVIYRQRRRDKSGNTVFKSSITRRTPTLDEVRARLLYCPDTGIFSYKVKRGKSVVGAPITKLSQQGYVELRINNRLLKAHNVAWFYMTGEWPPAGLTIDHINGVRSDNRMANLRLATRSLQAWNTAVSTRCKSGLKGAWPCKTTGRWQSVIATNGKKFFLGRFDTAQEAHEAWKAAAGRLRGSDAIMPERLSRQ